MLAQHLLVTKSLRSFAGMAYKMLAIDINDYSRRHCNVLCDVKENPSFKVLWENICDREEIYTKDNIQVM